MVNPGLVVGFAGFKSRVLFDVFALTDVSRCLSDNTQRREYRSNSRF